MIRLPLPRTRIAERVELTRAERHYLEDVLRLAPGDALEVFDGEGGRHAATLAGEGVLAVGPRSETPPPALRVTLAQALAKGEKMDLVVQKATELGAAAIAPFSSERAIVRLDERKAPERVERWRKIAAAAAGQSGRADVPEVLPLRTLAQVLARARAEGARALLLYENERELRLSRAVVEAGGPVWLLAGPEGGFSEAEVALAGAEGAAIVTLGPRVLRTETVALAALAVVQFLAGEFA